MRVRFRKGGQRKFLEMVRDRLMCASVRGILQFGVDVKYVTLKSYYRESRLMPEGLFNDLCELARIDKGDLDFEVVDDNWGRVLGGRISRR